MTTTTLKGSIADPGTLLVSDLDGTLLRSDGTLGRRTVQVVNRYIEEGGRFTVATARSFTSAAAVTQELMLTLPVITYGGAIIVDPRSGQPRQAQMLPEVTANDVLALTEGHSSVEPIVFAVWQGRDRLCWRPAHATPGIDRFLARRRGDPRLFPVSEWTAISSADVFYISLISEQTQLVELRTRLSANGVHATFSEDIYTPGDWALELTASSATKATAVTTLRDELRARRVVCFGDNQNDLPMFGIANWAVAVANAAPDIRAAAHEITTTNDTDGVAHWITENSHT
ncbi:MAG: HAD family hydrolase [Jatrophihabitantaceae bacterium]